METMIRKLSLTAVSLILLILCACKQTTPEPIIPSQDVEPSVMISEVLAGIQGNNSFEFIELFNQGDSLVDLQGWSLWYRLATTADDLLVFEWQESALLAPHGHFLLGRAGQDLGIVVDALFNQALNTSGGGLELRDSGGEPADSLGWGKAPESFVEGGAAVALENGVSLERQPGGESGNGTDTDDNASDFSLNPQPHPQNSGSLITPFDGERLAIYLRGPQSVVPGGSFEYELSVTNETNAEIGEALVTLPIPPDFQIVSLPTDMTFESGKVAWEVDSLAVDEERKVVLTLSAPWTYLTAVAGNYYVSTAQGDSISLGTPLWTRVEGGSLPINLARELLGEEVIIEGVTTMYTGGFYAGSGAILYVEDETAGVQVYVPGGGGVLEVPIGAFVRVRGMAEPYRGAVEIIPALPDDVEILDMEAADGFWVPEHVDLQQASSDAETLPGRLIQVEGKATRIEEFSYSYEMDLVNDEGQLLTLYIDKLTEIIVEPFEVGSRYSVVGILEVRDSFLRLNPRVQEDIVRLFPPVLMIEADAPNAVEAGEDFLVTFTLYNHTPEALHNVQVWAPAEFEGGTVLEILDGGQEADGLIRWTIPSLDGGGVSVDVHFRAQAGSTADQIINQGYGANAEEWPEDVSGEPLRIFVGRGVPIWAIQGAGSASPYKLENVTISGVVTGVFPSLGGFWIQELETDDDPRTSAGIFINTAELEISVERGALVEVEGRVRETSQQTQLQIDQTSDVRILLQNSRLPEAVILDPPVDDIQSEAYYETLEGMLVTVPGPAVTVGPTTRYGEYSLVLPEHQVERLWRGDATGMLITVDDGTDETHYDRSTLSYAVNTGDQVSGLMGPLAFTFGRFKIEPVVEPMVVNDEIDLPTLPATGTDEFSIMTWNVENLFDILDPHPSDPPRPRKAGYELSLTKIANTILAAGIPTVVGLQEVETLGILEDLSAHDSLVAYQYQPILLEGTDSRGVDVGYLVRGDQATIVLIEQHLAPAGLTSRPPLLIQIDIEIDQGSTTLYVINNHFTSLAGGELATEPRRNAQSEWNVTILEEVLNRELDALLAVIGDLNSFYDSLPIDTLREAGLYHVYEFNPNEKHYTYVFQGLSQSLDHILVTQPLMDLLVRVNVLHVNADYAPPDPDDPSPLRKSDHDPVIATFSLRTP
jgi:DNA/RNA endonuclease YhcR with UshA esterase domain